MTGTPATKGSPVGRTTCEKAYPSYATLSDDGELKMNCPTGTTAYYDTQGFWKYEQFPFKPSPLGPSKFTDGAILTTCRKNGQGGITGPQNKNRGGVKYASSSQADFKHLNLELHLQVQEKNTVRERAKVLYEHNPPKLDLDIVTIFVDTSTRTQYQETMKNTMSILQQLNATDDFELFNMLGYTLYGEGTKDFFTVSIASNSALF